jgi:hypothetical protein
MFAAKFRQSFGGPVIRHEQMIVVKGRNRIHADAGFGQSRRDRREKTHRVRRGTDGQRDQTRRKLVAQTSAFRPRGLRT